MTTNIYYFAIWYQFLRYFVNKALGNMFKHACECDIYMLLRISKTIILPQWCCLIIKSYLLRRVEQDFVFSLHGLLREPCQCIFSGSNLPCEIQNSRCYTPRSHNIAERTGRGVCRMKKCVGNLPSSFLLLEQEQRLIGPNKSLKLTGSVY